MFFNMKIEVNEDQPLDEIVSELEKRGYKCGYKTELIAKRVNTFADGYFVILGNTGRGFTDNLATLSELKEMKCSN